MIVLEAMGRSKSLTLTVRTVWLVLIARPPLGDELDGLATRQWRRSEQDQCSLEPNAFFLIGLAVSAVAILILIGTTGTSYVFDIDQVNSPLLRLLLTAAGVVVGLAFFLFLGVAAVLVLGLALWREHNVSRASFIDFAKYWLGEMLFFQALMMATLFFLLMLQGMGRDVVVSPLIGLILLFGIIHLVYIVLLQPGLAWAHLLNKSRARLVFTQFISVLPAVFMWTVLRIL